VISTVLSLAAIVVSRSPSLCETDGFDGFCFGGNLGASSLLLFFSCLPDENGVISAAKSFRIRLEISSSSMSGVGSLMIFLPALTKELFLGFSLSFSRDLEARDGGFLSQLYSILKSPLLKKLISYNNRFIKE
jgi:hypothetical protein